MVSKGLTLSVKQSYVVVVVKHNVILGVQKCFHPTDCHFSYYAWRDLMREVEPTILNVIFDVQCFFHILKSVSIFYYLITILFLVKSNPKLTLKHTY